MSFEDIKVGDKYIVFEVFGLSVKVAEQVKDKIVIDGYGFQDKKRYIHKWTKEKQEFIDEIKLLKSEIKSYEKQIKEEFPDLTKANDTENKEKPKEIREA